jgi:hypothetical protein
MAASRGIWIRARGPAARIRSPSTTTTESSIGVVPVPSISRAPTMAIGTAAEESTAEDSAAAQMTVRNRGTRRS